MTNTPDAYESPTIEKVGSLADLTKDGQRLNTDGRKTANSAVAFESI